ncbi:DNA methyltransferase, partial [bacterium]|nr:DNA methyltransferase [bacterium]
MTATYQSFIEVSTTAPELSAEPRQRGGGNHINRLAEKDRSAHDWYRFVLSYPPHLVRTYLDAFGANRNSVVLDPFCGTGTTIVESKKLGIPSIGIESVPVAQFAASVKTDWSVSPDILRLNAHRIAESTEETLRALGIDDL